LSFPSFFFSLKCDHRISLGLYTVFQKELYNFERVYRFIQRTYTMF
jgi:hypothetical protein